MAADWLQTRLGDVVSIKHGWPFKSEHFSEQRLGGPVVINIGNFRYTGGFRFEETIVKEYRGEYPGEYELAPGEILLVMTCQTAGGEILGIPARVPDDGRTYLHNQRLGRVIVTRPDRVDTDYLYWLFLSPEFNRALFLSASGTKILHTAPSRMEEFRFHLPSMNEQRTIAHILGTLDDKIELNRRMNDTLEAMARALFKSWFVDFGPVMAKAEGRATGLPTHLASLFPDRLVDSEMGLIPVGWNVGRLGEVAGNPRRGMQPSEIEPSTPYIGLEHMPRKCIALSEWSCADSLESGKYEFKRGEILFGKLRPYFHKVGVAPADGVCSTDIVVVAPKRQEWFGFVLGHISSANFVDHTDAGSTGTKMPRTSWPEMARYRLALPPAAIVERFNDITDPFIQRISANIHESRTLVAIRDSLLPKLLSGEIWVKEAERMVEAAV